MALMIGDRRRQQRRFHLFSPRACPASWKLMRGRSSIDSPSGAVADTPAGKDAADRMSHSTGGLKYGVNKSMPMLSSVGERRTEKRFHESLPQTPWRSQI